MKMWLYFVPVVVIGVFLAIIWETISPLRFFKQLQGERERRALERELFDLEDEEEDILNDKDDPV